MSGPASPGDAAANRGSSATDPGTAGAGGQPLAGGLTSAEASTRLARFGPNTVAEERPHLVRALLGKLNGPVPWMLEATVVLEAVAGKLTEALIVTALVIFNGVLSFVQEGRARGALALLRSRLAVRARVRRDGRWQLTEADSLVPGDLVHVRLGDIVPADIVAREGTVRADQSVLTGESAEVQTGPGGTLYAGSVIRSGEVTGEVTGTGAHTYFGRTAELVRSATTASHLEETIFKVVWSLLVMDGALVVAVLAYGIVTALPVSELLPFVLILLVASVPVALPATFTLATSLGAVDLARAGVLVTHLTAVEEAAAMDLVCTDKTGTLTRNQLSVLEVRPCRGFTESQVLALAAAASDDATQDPIDLAVLAAAAARGVRQPGRRAGFVPFDPAVKRSEALLDSGGLRTRVVKGAPAAVTALTGGLPDANADVEALAARGARVLGVAAGAGRLRLAGLIALGDPPRPDSASFIARLRRLGVRVVMVTGDAAATAQAVARQLGIGDRLGSAADLAAGRPGVPDGPLRPTGQAATHALAPGAVAPGAAAPRVPQWRALDVDVVAGVLPEDKLRLVEAAQRAGHVTGMTGDGVNDAPALKRAEVGIAVASATDVAKAAASVVLTAEGLGGVIAAVETGRQVYQRMLTYTLNKIAKTFQVSLFLGLGLLLAGAFVTTPRLILLLLFANDFVTMSIATDRVGFSPRPDRWQVPALSLAALAIAVPWLAFSFATYYVCRDVIGLGLAPTQTLVFVMLVATGQATIYLVRERRHLWQSAPSSWMLAATSLDLAAVTALAATGTLMAAVSLADIGVLLAAVAAATLLLDAVKAPLLRRLRPGTTARTEPT